MKSFRKGHNYEAQPSLKMNNLTFRIRPNYRTVRLGFSKLLENTCGKICICLLKGTHKKRSAKNLLDDVYAIFSDFLYKSICCGYSFELHRQVAAIQMGTHSICL